MNKFFRKYYFLLNLFWLLFSNILTALDEDREAAAFFAARDYYRAEEIYEKMMHRDLPPWKMAAVQYNLGTTKLALNDWENARHLFQSISPNSISSPYLLEYLVENIGLTYILQANSLIDKSDDIEMQIYLTKLGVYYIEEAHHIGCEWHDAEKKYQTVCTPTAEFEFFHRHGLLQLLQARQKQRETLFNNAEGIALITLLMEGTERLAATLDWTEKAPHEYASWLLKSGDSLSPLWAKIKNLSELEDALDRYTQALDEISKHKFDQSLESLSAVHTLLEGYLSTLKSGQEQILSLEAQILLLDDPLSLSLAEKLLAAHKKYQSTFTAVDSFKEGSRLLEEGITYLKAQNDSLARYYFLRYRYFLQDTFKDKSEIDSSPIMVLRSALDRAKQTLFLHRLASVAKPPVLTKKNQIVSTLLQFQQQAVEQSTLFVPAVLAQEAERFQQMGLIRFSRCQEQPWIKVMPLFETGYRNALLAYQSTLFPTPLALHRQEETVQNWERALKLITEHETQPPVEPQQSPEATQQTLQSLQEMELEDKPEKPYVPLELHSW